MPNLQLSSPLFQVTMASGNASECLLCLSEKIENPIALLTKCGHAFCWDCIVPHIQVSGFIHVTPGNTDEKRVVSCFLESGASHPSEHIYSCYTR